MADYLIDQMCDLEGDPLGYEEEDCMGASIYRINPMGKGIGFMKIVQEKIEAQMAWVKKYGNKV